MDTKELAFIMKFFIILSDNCLNLDEMTASSLFSGIIVLSRVGRYAMDLFHSLQSCLSCGEKLIFIFLKNIMTKIFLTLRT